MANLDLSKTSQDTDIATKVIKDNFIQYIYSTEDNCMSIEKLMLILIILIQQCFDIILI